MPQARNKLWSTTWWPRCAACPTPRAAGRRTRTSVKCQSCQAISVFDAARVGQRCDFCGSTALVPYEEVKEAFRPESLLPMKISEDQVRDSIRQWYGSRWFAPNKLKHARPHGHREGALHSLLDL